VLCSLARREDAFLPSFLSFFFTLLFFFFFLLSFFFSYSSPAWIESRFDLSTCVPYSLLRHGS
jgi:hypothetical protein